MPLLYFYFYFCFCFYVTACSPQEANGHGNTALVYHARRLMALEEGDVPYQLRIACSGLIETLGRVTYGGELQHAFTAHPKVDAKTGGCRDMQAHAAAIDALFFMRRRWSSAMDVTGARQFGGCMDAHIW